MADLIGGTPPPRDAHAGEEAIRVAVGNATILDFPTEQPRPLIRVVAGEVPSAVDAAEKALPRGGTFSLYQRGGLLVRPGTCPVSPDNHSLVALRLLPVTVPTLVDIFTTAARFERYDKRSEDWAPVDCPTKVAEIYASRAGQWKIPVLTGIIEAPTLRPDGSLLTAPGYDRATGLLLVPSCKVPKIPPKPSRDQARAALDTLMELLEDFPFVVGDVPDHSADRSVAISAILTTLVRRSLPTAPLHGFTAPVAGSGKSLLVDIASMIATGRPAPVISQGAQEGEFEKRLGGMLIAGDVLVAIDNCEAPLGGDLLCQALTQTVLKLRPLGTSGLVEVPSNAAIFATGNNLVLLGDMVRRALVARLDPETERPELRQFQRHPLRMIEADRGRYVAAGLTVLRAYVAAGRPTPRPPLANFEAWSNLVRSALCWLGEPDPLETMENVRQADPTLDTLAALVAAWRKVIGPERITLAELVRRANAREAGLFGKSDLVNADLHEALMMVAGEGQAINSRRLGRYLGKHKGRIVNGLRITQEGLVDGNMTWRLWS